MQSVKEKTSNVAASAKAGMEKTKATVDEKMEKMKTRDPMQKAAAEERKEERIMGAEAQKQAEMQENVAQRGHAATTGTGKGLHTTGIGHTTTDTGTGLPGTGLDTTGTGHQTTGTGHQTTGTGRHTTGTTGGYGSSV